MHLAPFFDLGGAWNVAGSASPTTIYSTGVGLLLAPDKHISAQLYWGYAFNRDVLANGNNLQDYGIHFFVSVNAF